MYTLNKNGTFILKNTKINSNIYITPFATDTHMHLLSFGQKLSDPDLEFKNENEIRYILEKELQKNRDTIILRGWSEETFRPEKNFLNKISSVKPILLIRRCGHIGIVNNVFFEKFTFEKFPQYINISENLITEKALEEFYEKNGYYTNIRESYETAKNYLLAKGYGFIHSEDIHGITPYDLPYENKELCIYEKIAVNSYKELENYYSLGYFVKHHSVKVYLDGSFGGRTACLKENYSDSSSKGVLTWEDEELKKVINFCENKNLHLAAHAIGDNAAEQFISVNEEVKPKQNHRMIHAAMLSDLQIQRIKNINIIADMQPAFIKSDEKILPARLENRINMTYRFGDIYKNNIRLFLSSDAPVEIPDWERDVITLKNLGLPLDFILKTILLSPEKIDNFNRTESIEKQRLIFRENPFENFTSPEKEIS